MEPCRTKLIVEGIREWDVGTCNQPAGHTGPHYLVTHDVRGRTVQITWRDDEEGITVSSINSSS